MPSVFVMRSPAAGYTHLFTDDFNRANSTTGLGGTWGPTFPVGFSGSAGPMGIVSNKAYYPITFTGTSDAGICQDVGAADVTVTVTISDDNGGSTSSGDYGGLVFRRASDGSFLRIDYNEIGYFNAAGAYTQLAIGSNIRPDNLTTPATVSVVLAGTSIKVYNGATLVYSITSSLNLTATQHGFWTYADFAISPAKLRYDDFSIAY